MTKTRYRPKTVKISADNLTYEIDGEELHLREGQWVEFRRKQTPNDLRQMLQLMMKTQQGQREIIE